MGVLAGIVIATLILVGVYVGYHAWQDSTVAQPHLYDPLKDGLLAPSEMTPELTIYGQMQASGKTPLLNH